jgi:hypothetical protein
MELDCWLNPVLRRNASWHHGVGLQSLPGNDRDGMMESALQALVARRPCGDDGLIAKTLAVNLPKDMQALVKAVHQSPDSTIAMDRRAR